MNLRTLSGFSDSLENTEKMPVLFIGHGSPMNGIEENEFTRQWKKTAREIPLPKAVLCISAHWLTQGTFVTAMEKPKTIHDFGGFPRELYRVQYPAPGSPALAEETRQLVKGMPVQLDQDWGLDHGSWTVIRKMYPNADVPVLQLSIDYNKPGQHHYDLAKELSGLRRKGVLILGSGNMVHNLGMMAWDKMREPEYGYDWALEMNTLFKKHITDKNHAALIHYENLGPGAKLAIPTPDHFYPLLYTLALQEKGESPAFFNDKAVGGSITMTSMKISRD